MCSLSDVFRKFEEKKKGQASGSYWIFCPEGTETFKDDCRVCCMKPCYSGEELRIKTDETTSKVSRRPDLERREDRQIFLSLLLDYNMSPPAEMAKEG
jgi:hypothetical protein